MCCSEEADPSCSASTLSNEEYASLLDAAMRFPDKQVHLWHNSQRAITKSLCQDTQVSKGPSWHTTDFF